MAFIREYAAAGDPFKLRLPKKLRKRFKLPKAIRKFQPGKALKSIAQAVPPERRPAVERVLARLDGTVARSYQDSDDRTDALQEDRQGLGLPDHIEVD